ncbi:MAG: acyl-ACP--UDP-N-acetylglucosamine O-acyltransferase [candidate division NC10 bacterium]|nr:acyl-ACP--UDP-N-acetylglucosamine O-acyltransferase [candidate division NC10 bacterium]MBI2113815.1 acyl-ACP--UDP-N-acetylglucosamine O-acyltransferase [candidate division NC10 bacterium]MBI3122294.1 acyl-ACP--UDP-N-acetylglucosamine O-acyltransferase [candidate division NC10 bacterium]
MVTVHPTAVVEPGAELAAGVQVGAYAIVGSQVRLGPGACVGSHTILEGRADIGADCRIGSHVIIGAPPQDVKYHGEPTRVVIGDRTLVREFATIHRASTGGSGVTRIGPESFIMAYAHVAHDCQLGEQVIMANQASLAGHVEIGRCAVIGGMSGVHQFVRIGEYAFLGACSAVLQDIPPFVKAQGNRAKPYGLNVVGLRRAGFSAETIQALKQAYRIVFLSDLNTSQALAQLEQELSGPPEVQRFIDFIKRSQRGISK